MARLLLGLPHPKTGRVCADFTVSLLTLGGECAALEVVEELGLDLQNLSISDRSLVDLAYLAQQVAFDEIEAELVTPQFLQQNLTTDDYALISAEIEQLRKKRIAALESPNSNHGEGETA